jgi:hypothetical protein
VLYPCEPDGLLRTRRIQVGDRHQTNLAIPGRLPAGLRGIPRAGTATNRIRRESSAGRAPWPHCRSRWIDALVASRSRTPDALRRGDAVGSASLRRHRRRDHGGPWNRSDRRWLPQAVSRDRPADIGCFPSPIRGPAGRTGFGGTDAAICRGATPGCFRSSPCACVYDIRKAQRPLAWEPALHWRDFERWELWVHAHPAPPAAAPASRVA